ncbi:MAG: B12-binding domain-containing radical SAM protein [Elusimicrobiales bacterium]|nr:B12-binding domain-containing radical SAM protein [Elusimicrobiales bacterium]
MDITLVNIASKTTYDGKRVNLLSTVGIYSLAACLEQAGVKVDFREYFLDFEKGPARELAAARTFFSKSAGIVAIGCHAIHLPFAVKAVQAIKKDFPGKTVILGGIGPSIVAKPLMEKFPEIDLVVVGEAEISLPKVVKALLAGGKGLAKIPGLMLREGGRVKSTGPQTAVTDLDTLPLPAYKYLDVKRYPQPMAMSARGCPFSCPFCSLSAYWKGKIRFRSADKMVEELKVLQAKGVKSVFFADPCFMFDKKRLLQFIAAVKKNRVKLEYKCYGRLDMVSEEMCRLLVGANFKTIFFGLETGSDAVLKQIKGGFTVADGLEKIRRNRKYFPRVEVSLMWGFPFETLEDLKQTIAVHDYLKNELKCVVQLTWFQPFANTAYFNKYKDSLVRHEGLSAIYDRKQSRAQVLSTIDDCGEFDYTISLRSMIGHSHVYSMAADIVDANPLLFPDFYRYQTPDLPEKIRLVNRIVPS